MIPKELVYRIYNNELAIIMNIQENKVVLLQNEPLKLWQNILENNQNIFNQDENQILDELKANGLIVNDDKTLSAPTASVSIQEVDISIVNYWAFKNHIPLSGHFELTSQCNLRCKHCYTMFTKEDKLSTKNVFDIIDQMEAVGTLGLVLTGGEIFARKDIVDILRYLYEKKFVLRLNTNGLFIDEDMINQIKEYTTPRKSNNYF